MSKRENKFKGESAKFLQSIDNSMALQVSTQNLKDSIPAVINIKKVLEEKCDKLVQINSSFPATKSFLEKKGLNTTKQLDKKGREELISYLKNIITKKS